MAATNRGEFYPFHSFKPMMTTIFQSFESADGIKVEESGKVKQITPEDAGITARGSYSYTAPDGTVIKMDWVADENGFQPTGAHLPVAPPTPDHVVKLLDDLRALGAL